MAPAKNILIVRTSAIGDVVFASPIAAALKRSWPDCRIAWLVEPAIAPLLEHDPLIDELIHWPKSEWQAQWKAHKYHKLWRAVQALSRNLKAQRFDLAIDLQGLLKSGLLTRLSGAPQRIGLGSREGSQWLMTRVVDKGGDAERISSEYLYLAQQLGLDVGDFLPRLILGAAARERAKNLLAQQGLLHANIAVLAPFTTRPQKHWFEDAWRDLAKRLHERKMVPLILGGPNDQEAAARIAQAAPRAVSLAGQTHLPAAAALIEQAKLLIGVDTGLTHMGIAFATPTVALFGSTCPYLNTGRTNARVIWLGLECSPCRRRPTCHGAFTCLREITVDQVLTEAETVLQATE